MKRILSFLLSSIFLLGVCCVNTRAAATVASGICGDGVSWVLDYNGTMTLTGKGDMYDYQLDNDENGVGDNDAIPWSGYRALVKKVVIGDGITKIGNWSFKSCRNLQEIAMADSVTVIGNQAFYHCVSLSKIKWSAKTKSIGWDAFKDCTSLSSVIIPSKISVIYGTAFYWCTSLTDIQFIGSKPEIYSDAFQDVTATVFYPANDNSWKLGEFSSYGGKLTWLPRAKEKNTIFANDIKKTSRTQVQSFYIKTKVYDSARLKYKSDNKKIAVNQSGKVTISKGYVGRAVITIQSSATERYEGATKKIQITVIPETAKLAKVSSPKKGYMKAAWKKIMSCSGYQMQISLKPNFAGAKAKNISKTKLTYTVSGFKSKKKYFVRIRAYEKVGSKTYYGSWSKAKSVKVK